MTNAAAINQNTKAIYVQAVAIISPRIYAVLLFLVWFSTDTHSATAIDNVIKVIDTFAAAIDESSAAIRV